MSEASLITKERLSPFIETAIERHKIYLKREAGFPSPWTEDPIYQKYFFCNVFRQYDKCSKWMIENILPFERWDLIILYRFISTMETYEIIKRNAPLDDLNKVYNVLVEMYNNGMSIFSGCFIRNPMYDGKVVNTFTVPFRVIKDIKEDDKIHKALEANKLETMVKFLKRYSGIAGFMGYEYACDFEYTDYFNPTDKYTWANMGPGAKRGLSWLVYGSQEHPFTESSFLYYIRYIYVEMKKRFNEMFPDQDFAMREVEHWLCEYQKYKKYETHFYKGIQCKYRKYDGINYTRNENVKRLKDE